jgi:hypothetical protein
MTTWDDVEKAWEACFGKYNYAQDFNHDGANVLHMNNEFATFCIAADCCEDDDYRAKLMAGANGATLISTVLNYLSEQMCGKHKQQEREELCADPVFVRLLWDVAMSRRVKDKIQRGLLPKENFDDADDLERGAFQHLINYLDAKAWVRSTPDDM